MSTLPISTRFERSREAGNSRYFEELLQRIRDIRSSEKVFWRKVLDIFSTSIDYDSHSEAAGDFFAKIQNQLHCQVAVEEAALNHESSRIKRIF